jgi:glucosamine kinase
MNGAAYYIGLDGGATHCRARLRDGSGRALAEASGPAANVHVDFVRAVTVLHEAVREILSKAQLTGADRAQIAIGFGLAGFKDASDAQRIVEAFPGYRVVRAANDATTACIGAHAGADGGLVIAGTGSAATARVSGRETIIGGRGFTVGDDGSGSHIGLNSMRAAMLAYDQLGPASALTREILAEFNDDPVMMMQWARDAKPGDFGALAPRVFKYAALGDGISLGIAQEAGRAIGVLTRRVIALGAQRVALVGGVGEALRPYLEPEISESLSAPLHDATDGAILFVGGIVATEKEFAP